MHLAPKSLLDGISRLRRRDCLRFTDVVVVVALVEPSMATACATFLGGAHPAVTSIFVCASTLVAIRQLIARRTGQRLSSVAFDLSPAWALGLGAMPWCVFAVLHENSQAMLLWQPLHVPLAVRVVGVCCLLFPIVAPFTRSRSAGAVNAVGQKPFEQELARFAVDSYAHAIGAVLLTASPLIALMAAVWVAVTGRTSWHLLRTMPRGGRRAPRLAAAAHARGVPWPGAEVAPIYDARVAAL